MKILDNIKKEKKQIHMLAIFMYVLGVVCDAYGYLSLWLEWFISLPLLLGAICFSISIACTWFANTKKYLKAATIHLFLLIIGTISLFFYGFWGMWISLALTTIFLMVIIVLFIIDLVDVYQIYSKIVQREKNNM